MKVSHKTVNNTLYVALCGEIDESCAAEVRAKLDALFEEDGLIKVVMDFAAVTFMDSTGIGMLIGRYKTLKKKGIPLLISSPKNAVDKLLLLSGIYEIVPKLNG